jgi:hypothetical protein
MRYDLTYVLNFSKTTQIYTAHIVRSNLVQNSERNSKANIFKDFPGKCRDSLNRIKFGVGISYFSILINLALKVHKLWFQNIHLLSIMIVALECIAFINTILLLKSHAASSVSNLAIFVFHLHIITEKFQPIVSMFWKIIPTSFTKVRISLSRSGLKIAFTKIIFSIFRLIDLKVNTDLLDFTIYRLLCDCISSSLNCCLVYMVIFVLILIR